MPDYQTGKIYSIRAPGTDEVYIGSTTLTLSLRMAHHRNDYKRWKTGKRNYVSSFKILDYDGAYIELVEEYPCDSREQLNRREGEIMRATTNCVNQCIAGRTDAEYHEVYREINKEKRNAYQKTYYESNKEREKAQRKARYAAKKSIIHTDATSGTQPTNAENLRGDPHEIEEAFQ